MRPLRLEIAGLRSYRAKQVLDFSDLSLFAVIGDTGAGKSSILEAIVFALYAGSTWDARGGGALISLDADAMSVVFDFSVDGKRYRVKRVVFRNARPSEHALTSPDDPECRFQGERPVNAEIRRLVGLDYDTFKKTVVLPQGRFAALLEMSETDRSKVLTELLGLDGIDRLREKLEPARQEAAGRKRDALAKRGELGADPAAEAARLEEA
ncbi:MAG: SMC family ATPase, partial [Candidatus Baltobacteraceae bacterium]